MQQGRAVWDRLIEAARAAHEGHAELQGFCPFPSDLKAQDVTPYHIPASDLLQGEAGFGDTPYGELAQALVEGAPHAWWRETYKDTSIGDDFMSRFGCYGIIGPNAPFASREMFAWVVYMPAHLDYPWHHHPAEEVYLSLAGRARFLRHGAAEEDMLPGRASFHASNQPHATATGATPFLAYVVWRNGFDTAPVLTEGWEQGF